MSIPLAQSLVKHPAIYSVAKKAGGGAFAVALVALMPHADLTAASAAGNALVPVAAPGSLVVPLAGRAQVTRHLAVSLDSIEGDTAHITLTFQNCVPGECIGIVRPPSSAALTRGRSAYYAGYTIRLDSLTAASATFSISS